MAHINYPDTPYGEQTIGDKWSDRWPVIMATVAEAEAAWGSDRDSDWGLGPHPDPDDPEAMVDDLIPIQDDDEVAITLRGQHCRINYWPEPGWDYRIDSPRVGGAEMAESFGLKLDLDRLRAWWEETGDEEARSEFGL
jgi:hypothetical protein